MHMGARWLIRLGWLLYLLVSMQPLDEQTQAGLVDYKIDHVKQR